MWFICSRIFSSLPANVPSKPKRDVTPRKFLGISKKRCILLSDTHVAGLSLSSQVGGLVLSALSPIFTPPSLPVRVCTSPVASSLSRFCSSDLSACNTRLEVCRNRTAIKSFGLQTSAGCWKLSAGYWKLLLVIGNYCWLFGNYCWLLEIIAGHWKLLLVIGNYRLWYPTSNFTDTQKGIIL